MQTWRDVLLGDDNRGNIIQFYNKTFIRELEAYLLKFKADGSGAEDTTPVSIPVSPLKIPVSPIQVEPRHNLYMSPISGQRHQLYSTSPIMTHSMGFSPAKVRGAQAPRMRDPCESPSLTLCLLCSYLPPTEFDGDQQKAHEAAGAVPG